MTKDRQKCIVTSFANCMRTNQDELLPSFDKVLIGVAFRGCEKTCKRCEFALALPNTACWGWKS